MNTIINANTVINARHGDNHVIVNENGETYEVFSNDTYIGETSDFMKVLNICTAILNCKDGNWELLTTMRL